MKILKYFLFILLLYFQFSLWFGKNSILDYIQIYREIKIQKKEDIFYRTRNEKLEEEIKDFYRGRKY